MAVQVQHGDTAAASALMARYHDGLYGLALRMLRNREDAAEVAQEAMVKALAKIDTYDPTRPFAPWLFRIARNLCVDRHRRKRPTAELDEGTTAALDWTDGGNRFGQRPDHAVHQQHLSAVVVQAMDDLPPMYRRIIEMYHFEHMSYREIADALELPDGTVMNRLFRARKKLQAAMLARGIAP